MKLKLPKVNFKGIDAKKGLGAIKVFMSNNAPELAATVAILTMGAAVFTAIKQTKKFNEELEQAEIAKKEEEEEVTVLDNDEELDDEETKSKDTEKKEEHKGLTKKEKACIIVKCYWPVALLTVASGVMMVASVKFSHKQLKAAMMAATMAETALANKDSALRDILTPKQAEQVAMAENKEELEKHKAPVDDSLIERSTIVGDTLMYEPVCKRYFYSDIEGIRAAITSCREDVIDAGEITVNEYLNRLGLASLDECFDDIGWEFDRTGNIKASVEYDPDVNRRPTAVIKHRTLPQVLSFGGHHSRW